jgi:CRISPR-associated protein Cmx8
MTDTLSLDYELFDLPTALHKAGLAGMLLHIQNLKEREVDKPIPEIERLDAHSARVQFRQDSLQTLMDDVYDARWVEIKVKNRYPNKAPKREEQITNGQTGKAEKRFVYDACEPKANLLRSLLQNGVESPWHKLWRDMLWNVLRAQPKTRGVYEVRANGKPCDFTPTLWANLVKTNKQKIKEKFVTDSISGSLFPGAQDENAERVPFKGRVEHNLLLHFWAWITPVFVPRVVNVKEGRLEDRGFVLAVPEVADLSFFLELIREYWQRLDTEVRGYRPAQSLIDLPEEGGLEFLHQLAEHNVRQLDIACAVHTVELYHQERQDKNVRMLVAERLRPTAHMLDEYQRLIQHGHRLNPLYKSLRIRNLLDGRSWHEGAQSIFAGYPRGFFIHTAGTPHGIPFFGADVHKQFQALIDDLKRQEDTMTEPAPQTLDDALARRIYSLIRSYVRQKAEMKSGVDIDALPKNEKGYPDYPKPYLDAKEKAASSAFLAMRGRRREDFIEYFTGTICAVPQWLPEEDYLAVSRALIEQPDTVKNLAMLALSAHSYTPNRKNQIPETDQDKEISP